MSFESDNDEEVNVAEIEEEEWVEYNKRSTIEAIEKMDNEKIRCWKLTQRKIKWRLAMRIGTSLKGRWLIKAAEWNSAQNTGPTDLLADQEKDGKTTSTNSSNKWRTRLKI